MELKVMIDGIRAVIGEANRVSFTGNDRNEILIEWGLMKFTLRRRIKEPWEVCLDVLFEGGECDCVRSSLLRNIEADDDIKRLWSFAHELAFELERIEVDRSRENALQILKDAAEGRIN